MNVSGGEPSHVPAVSASVWPTMTVPVIAGVTRRCGGIALTTFVDSEFCVTEAAEFVAVTWDRIDPVQVVVMVKVLTGRAGSRSSFPSASHLHWYAGTSSEGAVQVPFDVDRVSPTFGTPVVLLKGSVITG